MTPDEYENYRIGMFHLTAKCLQCGEEWQTVACAQYQPFCGACDQAYKWMHETHKLLPTLTYRHLGYRLPFLVELVAMMVVGRIRNGH